MCRRSENNRSTMHNLVGPSMKMSRYLSTLQQTNGTTNNVVRSQPIRLFGGNTSNVRRALTSIGTRKPNQSAANIKFAREHILGDVENFRNKYNFDPIKFKPIKTANPRYEYTKIRSKREIEASKERKEMQNHLFSLPENRNQSIKSFLSKDYSENEEPSIQVKDEEIKISEELQERLAPTKTELSTPEKIVPIVTASVAAKIISSSTQRKITDFTQHRKRVLSTSEDDPTLDSQPSKKAKMGC